MRIACSWSCCIDGFPSVLKASGRLPPVLALEIPRSWRPTEDRRGPAHFDPADERGKSVVGRAAYPCLPSSFWVLLKSRRAPVMSFRTTDSPSKTTAGHFGENPKLRRIIATLLKHEKSSPRLAQLLGCSNRLVEVAVKV